MDNNGWIKLHRKFTDWEWYQEPNMVLLFLTFMLLANHDDGQWKGQSIKRGQFITGLDSLSKQTGISAQSLRTCITRLKSTGEITSTSTNRFRIITIVKYDDYQKDDRKSTNKLTYKSTDNQQATNKQLTANNKNKNDNKNKNNTSEQCSEEVAPFINLFKVINPTYQVLFGRPNQRDASSRLLKIRTLIEWEKVIEFIISRRSDRFCPRISTPIQLEQKYSDLETYAMGLKGEIIKNKEKYKVAF